MSHVEFRRAAGWSSQANVVRSTDFTAGRGEYKGARGAPLCPFTDTAVSCFTKHQLNGILFLAEQNNDDNAFSFRIVRLERHAAAHVGTVNQSVAWTTVFTINAHVAVTHFQGDWFDRGQLTPPFAST